MLSGGKIGGMVLSIATGRQEENGGKQMPIAKLSGPFVTFLQNSENRQIRIDEFFRPAYVPAAIAERHFSMTIRQGAGRQPSPSSQQEPKTHSPNR
jgi:hypothetical protein